MIKEFLVNFGYTEAQCNKIFNNSEIKKLHENTLFLNIKQNIKCFKLIGYRDEEIIKMTADIPQIFGLSSDNLRDKFKGLLDIGYDKKRIIRMTSTIARIYTISLDNITNKIKNLKKLTYSDDQILYITGLNPAIFTHSTESINDRFNNIKSLNFSVEQVIYITMKFPNILTSSEEGTVNRISLLRDIGIESIIFTDTKQLIQSPELTYARYMFLKKNGEPTNITNYRRLFYRNTQFERIYGVTKNELLSLYPFDEYLKSKKEEKNVRPL